MAGLYQFSELIFEFLRFRPIPDGPSLGSLFAFSVAISFAASLLTYLLEKND